MSHPHQPDDYDSPWKDAIEHYLPEFMAFYFPQAFAQIDWGRGYTFLDQELHAVTKDAELGRRLVDKLVQVYLVDGQAQWVYVHIEVQGQPEKAFPLRLFTYNYRIFDKYGRPVATLAVLADDDPNWRPNEFKYELMGCTMGLSFPSVKLLDFADQSDTLLTQPNPFALVTLAHLQTRATHHDMTARYHARLKLVRMLYERDWDRQRIIDLFYAIDWMMSLPPDLNRQLWQDVQNFEQEKKVAYVSSFQLMLREDGRQEGLQKGLQKGLQEKALAVLQKILIKRFGSVPEPIVQQIQTAPPEQLDQWFDRALDAQTLDQVFASTAR